MAAKKAKSILERFANTSFETTDPVDITKHIAAKASDELKAGAHDAWDQLLGKKDKASEEHAKKGEMKAGEPISFTNHKNKKEDRGKLINAEKKFAPYIEAGIDYRREIIHGAEMSERRNNRELETKLQEIVIELKRLASSSKVLQAEFREVTVEQRITKPGKYHVNFFEWVLTVVRSARMRVEDSGAWLTAMKGKKKKGNYWEQFKKQGTSFALSNERNVATQVG